MYVYGTVQLYCAVPVHKRNVSSYCGDVRVLLPCLGLTALLMFCVHSTVFYTISCTNEAYCF